MSSSAITTPTFQAKIGSIQNQADSSGVYSAGVWSFKNSTALTSVTISDAGAVTLGPSGFTGQHVVNGGLSVAVGSAAAPSYSFTGDTDTGIYRPAANELALVAGGVERMRIDGSGSALLSGGVIELGVGRVSDGNAFIDFHSSASVDFNARIHRSSGVNGAFEITQTGSGPLVFATSGVERARIGSNGSFLVDPSLSHTNGSGVISARGFGGRAGTNGAASNVFNIHWAATAQLWIDTTNLGTIAFTSDYRIKKNIETQELPALERIAQLRPVKYELADYKELFKADGVQREGFIAHELQAVIPSAVEGEKDAEDQIQSLKLDALCSVLVKALQELSAKVEEQSSRIDAQAAEIEALEARLAALEAKP